MLLGVYYSGSKGNELHSSCGRPIAIEFKQSIIFILAAISFYEAGQIIAGHYFVYLDRCYFRSADRQVSCLQVSHVSPLPLSRPSFPAASRHRAPGPTQSVEYVLISERFWQGSSSKIKQLKCICRFGDPSLLFLPPNSIRAELGVSI